MARPRQASDRVVKTLARTGLVVRGILYVLVGSLALQVAFGRPSAEPDSGGALATVARQPFGRVAVAALALGFVAHAAWRFLQAAIDPGDEGGVAQRFAFFARGLVYVVLVGAALPYLRPGPRSGLRGQEQDVTMRVLELPLGRVVVAGAGLVTLAVAAVNGYRAVTGRHQDRLRTDGMPAPLRIGLTVLGSVGLIGRFALFSLVGVFLVRAAARAYAGEAVGIDGALQRLAARSYGPPLLVAVAVAIVAFGLYSLAEARYRHLVKGDGGGADRDDGGGQDGGGGGQAATAAPSRRPRGRRSRIPAGT